MVSNKSLYPDILFHFTSKEGLWGILERTFSVSYANEKISGNRKSVEFSIPMVSFCDLKISELKSHMEKYGNYGIGLKKDWANIKGLNPVFYVNKTSPFTSNFITAIEQLRRTTDDTKGIINKAMAEGTYMDILNVYRYMKNYEGELTRKNGKKTKNYRFADEREWRYVPPYNQNSTPFLPLENNLSNDEKHINGMTTSLNLDFQPDDIKYLIIESDGEITELISHLDSVKERFDMPTKRRLASRILTSEQINNDV